MIVVIIAGHIEPQSNRRAQPIVWRPLRMHKRSHLLEGHIVIVLKGCPFVVDKNRGYTVGFHFRLGSLPGEITDARGALAQLQATASEPVADGPALLVEARQLRRAAELAAADARVRELEAEKRRLDAEAGLVSAQRDRSSREVDRQQNLVDDVNNAQKSVLLHKIG